MLTVIADEQPREDARPRGCSLIEPCAIVPGADLPIDCILSFLFPAETDVLVPVLSQSTDVVVVNFVVVLKFPNIPARPNILWTPNLQKNRRIVMNSRHQKK